MRLAEQRKGGGMVDELNDTEELFTQEELDNFVQAVKDNPSIIENIKEAYANAIKDTFLNDSNTKELIAMARYAKEINQTQTMNIEFDLESYGYEIVTPNNVNSLKLSSTKLTNQLILSPVSEILATKYGVNVASQKDKREGKNVITYFEILENSSIKLPENFEFTEKTARYIDAIGSALEDETIRENGGIIKVKHLLNIMNGKNASNVRDEEINTVLDDLETLASVRIKIDATQHGAYNKEKKDKHQLTQTVYSDYLLPTGMRGGADGEKYIIIKNTPPLYQYAKELGHIMTYKKSDLDFTRIYVTDDTGTVIKEIKTAIKYQTERVNVVIGYFMRNVLSRLDQLKKNTKKGKKPYVEVTYKTLYDYMQLQEPGLNINHRKADINKLIYNVLDVMKQKNLISNFDSEIGKGRVRKYKIRIY